MRRGFASCWNSPLPAEATTGGGQQGHRRETRHTQQSKHPNRANLLFILKQTREPWDAGLGRQLSRASLGSEP